MAGRKLFLANMISVCMVLFLGSRSLILTVAEDDPQILEVGHGCSPESYRYVNESAFQDNLDTAFKSLASNISSSNVSYFATSVSNKSDTDEVYALLLCRKYLTSQECLQCFTAAEMRLKQLCSNKGFNGGRIYMDGCLLRYENNTGFFEQATDGGFYSFCGSVYDTKPQDFNQTADMLLSQLTANASNSDDKYAAGEASNALTVVYGVAQCAPTLSKANCNECLTAAQILVINNCLPKQEGRGLEGGCFMRYANYSFYSDSTSTNSKSNRNSEKWPTLLGSVGAVLAVLW